MGCLINKGENPDIRETFSREEKQQIFLGDRYTREFIFFRERAREEFWEERDFSLAKRTHERDSFLEDARRTLRSRHITIKKRGATHKISKNNGL